MNARIILFPLLFFLFPVSNSFPQDALKKGVYNLSGGISYSSTSEDSPQGDYSQSVFSFNPGMNYFISDNLMIGGSISFIYSESKSTYFTFTSKAVNRQFAIGPQIRYYFPGTSIAPFIGFRADYLKMLGASYDGRSFTFMTGINYFVSGNASIEPYVEYRISSYKSGPDMKTFSFGFRMSYFILN